MTREYFGVNASDKFHDGWLKTGDIAVMTEKEQMIIKDRSKDMIKSGGKWISSVDMEGYVMGMSEVEMAVVVAVPHPKWQERPIVIVKLKKGQRLAREKVLECLRNKFSKFQIPDDVLFWSEIPVTGTGKMSKKLVRERLKREMYKLPELRAQSKL